jgi:hypothetical protein
MNVDGLDVVAMAVLMEVIEGPGSAPGHPGPCWSPRARLELIASPGEIDGLISAGWLEAWVGIVGGPALTLTPLAAHRLDVELDEFDWDETPSWVRAGTADHAVVIPRHQRCGVPLPYPERVVDLASVRPVEYLRDETWSDEPVTLWGMPVPIDPRVRGKRAG